MDILFFFRDLVKIHFRGVLFHILKSQFFLEIRDGIPENIPAASVFIDRLLHFLQIFFQKADAALQFLDLPAAPQKITVITESAACHGTSGIQGVPFQRNHSQTVTVFLPDGDCMVDMIDDKNSSQKIFHQRIVLLIRMNKGVRRTDHPWFLKSVRILDPPSAADIGQRQESGPAVAVLFQKVDHSLCGLFIVGYDILYAAAQSCLHSQLIIFLHLDDIRYHAPDTRFLFFLFHDPSDTVSVPVVSLCEILQGFQSGRLAVIGGLSGFHLPVLLFQSVLKLLHFFIQADAFRVHGFYGRRNAFVCTLGFFPLCRQRLLFCLKMKGSFTDLCPADIQLLHHRIKTLGFSLGCSAAVEKFDDLVFAVLYRAGAFLHAGKNRFQMLLFSFQSAPDLFFCREKFVSLLFPLRGFVLSAGDLILQRIHPVLIMLAVLLSRGNLFLKHFDLAFVLLPGKGVLLLFFLQRVQLLVQFFKFFFEALIFGLRLIIGLFCLSKFMLRNFQSGFQFFQKFSGTVILHEEEIHIQFPQFISPGKIYFSRFRLFFQRSQLFRQLVQDIGDTDKVSLLFLQLLDRSVLSSFELHDSGSLVKKLAPVLRLAA